MVTFSTNSFKNRKQIARAQEIREEILDGVAHHVARKSRTFSDDEFGIASLRVMISCGKKSSPR